MKYLFCIIDGLIIGHFITRIKRLLLAGSVTKKKWVVFARLVEPDADRLFEVGTTTNYTKACRASEELDGMEYFIGEVAELDVTPEYLAGHVHDWHELSADEQNELYIAQGLLL